MVSTQPQIQQIYTGLTMLNILALKLKNPHLIMNFSKIKLTDQPAKPIVPGLRSPPMMKKPTLNPNGGIMPKNPNLVSKVVKKEVLGKMQAVTNESAFIPVLKKKHAVVTIMGHVDHGKTTLIDHLRKSDIAQKEDGGITQRISAFRINCLGERITFIDTPGHEAFTNMRQRGASVTDIVVLVVSATEGVKKQTLEVIQLLKKWQVPVIVAINKIDLPEANPEEVEEELTKAGLDLETNGGQIPVIHISAKTGLNVELLCELIIQETKNGTALFNGMAEAFVLEAMQTKQKLNAMTIVMRKGTLKINSAIIVGQQACKVRSILDDRGESLTEALPGEAVQIVGIPFIPAPGDLVIEMQSLDRAKHAVSQTKAQQQIKKETENKDKSIDQVKIKFARGRQGRREKRAFYKGIREVWMIKFAETQEKLLTQLEELKKKEGNPVIDAAILQVQEKLENHKQYVAEYFKKQGDNPQVLNFILKFGDRGMEETILMQLQALKPALEEEVKIKLNLISCDVGSVSVTDIQQAQTFNARIFTFGADISGEAKRYITDNENIRNPRTHKLIHNLLKDLKDVAYEKKLATIKGNEKARCDIAELFVLKSKKTPIPGIKVSMGKITRTTKAYVFRAGIPISQPLDIAFLKSFKKEMVELKKGQEGTIGFVQECSLEKGDELRFFQQN